MTQESSLRGAMDDMDGNSALRKTILSSDGTNGGVHHGNFGPNIGKPWENP